MPPVQETRDAGIGGEIVDLGENDYVQCAQYEGYKKCSIAIEIGNVRCDLTESAKNYPRITVKSDVINISENLNDDQLAMIQGDQSGLITSNKPLRQRIKGLIIKPKK